MTAQDPASAIAGMFQPSAPVAPAVVSAPPPQQQQSSSSQDGGSGGGGDNGGSRHSDTQRFGQSMTKEDQYGYGDEAFQAALDGKKPQDAKDGEEGGGGEVKDGEDDANKVGEAKADDGSGEKPAPTDEELDAHLNKSNLPKQQKENWKQMRSARAALEKANQELLAKNKEYEERLGKAGPVPDDLKKEVEATNRKYQEAAAKLREQEITADPEFVRKYVEPVKANNNQIREILLKNGRNNGHSEEVIQQALAHYDTTGYTLKGLKEEFKAFEENGDLDAAETVRELIRANIRLGTEKANEMKSWQEGYTARSADREQRQRAEMEEAIRIGNESAQSTFTANLRDLAEKFPLLKEPPKPLSTDSPAVSKAKQAAYDQWSKAMDVQADLDALNNELGLPDQKKVAAARGRIFALAKQGLALQRIIANQYPQSEAATKKELAELKSKLAAMNKTGDLSRAHAGDMGAQQQQPLKASGNTEQDFERALRAAMPGAGG